MKWLYLLIVITLVVAAVDRFSYPELTETQLFLRLWPLYSLTNVACLASIFLRKENRDKMKPHFGYLKYVLRHKWFVLLAGLRLRVSLWQLLTHDWSKFLPSEWFAYVAYFYGKGQKEAAKQPFDIAWNHHQKRQPHHWQYWVLIRDSDEPRIVAQPMPERFIREMVADWAGAGRAISGQWEVKQWWFGTEERPGGNRVRILLHPKTLDLVDGFVIQLDQELNAETNEAAESEEVSQYWLGIRMAKEGKKCCFCGHEYTSTVDIVDRDVIPVPNNSDTFEIACKACYEKSQKETE